MSEFIYKEWAEGYAIHAVKTGELIRCKDCKHNESGVCSWHCSKDYTWCVDDDDYCSVAERKDNGQNG